MVRLDPRLGFRRLGGWALSLHEDILTNVEAGLARLRCCVERLAGSVPVAVALPTLPIAPIEISAAAQALNVEASLWAAVWNFAEWCVSKHKVRVLSMAEIDRVSQQTERFDLRSEISFGSPYALPHASAMAELLSRLLAPPPPLKGLITDLDGTLWHGILGEAGAPGVSSSFTLDSGGVRSVACISNCSNLLRSAGCCLPLQARTTRHWSRTLSPARTCWSSKIDFFRSWQIGDRSPNPFDRSWPPGTSDRKRWLSSTTARWRSKKCGLIFLELRTVVFPSEPSKALDLLRDLREWFGKPVILDEDRLRAQSLRQATAMGTLPGEPPSRETFLSALEARISFQLSRDAQDQRAFELVNKTNQFNLNGRRITETGWRQTLENPEGFL